jgi:hypothetical protein
MNPSRRAFNHGKGRKGFPQTEYSNPHNPPLSSNAMSIPHSSDHRPDTYPTNTPTTRRPEMTNSQVRRNVERDGTNMNATMEQNVKLTKPAAHPSAAGRCCTGG